MTDQTVITLGDRVKRTVIWSVIGAVFLYSVYVYDQYVTKETETRQSVVCPSFLSIARSSRDTLIVMRNEPLCNRYVLDNLQ